MKIKQLIIFSTILWLFGCVPTEPVTLSTNPMGATVYIDGENIGNTPVKIDLTLDRDHLITITKDTYKQEDIEIKRIFKKDKEAKNIISGAISSAQSVNANPFDIANSVIKNSGTDNPNNFTFENNIVTITLTPLNN